MSTADSLMYQFSKMITISMMCDFADDIEEPLRGLTLDTVKLFRKFALDYTNKNSFNIVQVDVATFLLGKSGIGQWLQENGNCSFRLDRNKLNVHSLGLLSDTLFLDITREIDNLSLNIDRSFVPTGKVMGTLICPLTFLSEEFDLSETEEEQSLDEIFDSLTAKEVELIATDVQKTTLDGLKESCYSSEVASLMIIWE